MASCPPLFSKKSPGPYTLRPICHQKAKTPVSEACAKGVLPGPSGGYAERRDSPVFPRHLLCDVGGPGPRVCIFTLWRQCTYSPGSEMGKQGDPPGSEGRPEALSAEWAPAPFLGHLGSSLGQPLCHSWSRPPRQELPACLV